MMSVKTGATSREETKTVSRDDFEEEEGELSRIGRALGELVSAVGGLGVKSAENLVLFWGRLANGLVLHRFHKRQEVSRQQSQSHILIF